MKPVNPKPEKYISFPPELNEKLIHLRLVVMYKFQSIKTYILRVINQIGFLIKKIRKYN